MDQVSLQALLAAIALPHCDGLEFDVRASRDDIPILLHDQTLERVHRQQLVEVDGQSDIGVFGLPYLCPYNVNSVMNPILAACLGLGYFFNMYVGQPLVRKGGAVILNHPVPWEFSTLHHPYDNAYAGAPFIPFLAPMWRRADGIIAVSEPVREWAIRRLGVAPERVRTIVEPLLAERSIGLYDLELSGSNLRTWRKRR